MSDMQPIVQPERACQTCWRVWLHSRPRSSFGYCWHGSVAWQARPGGEFLSANNIDREEYRVIARTLGRQETRSLDA